MAARDLLGRWGDKASGSLRGERDSAPDAAPLGGTRAEAMQRLQVGLTGLFTMVFVISVATILGGQADIAEDAAVPDAAPTTEPTAAPPQRDPLADAGVVPNIPQQPEAPQTGAPPEPNASINDRTRTVPDTEPTKRRDSQSGGQGSGQSSGQSSSQSSRRP